MTRIRNDIEVDHEPVKRPSRRLSNSIDTSSTSTHRQFKRIRRTLTFLNLNRKRIPGNRRLSLAIPSQTHVNSPVGGYKPLVMKKNKILKTSTKQNLSAIKQHLKKYTDEVGISKKKMTTKRVGSNVIGSAKRKRQSQGLHIQSIFGWDNDLKEYMEKPGYGIRNEELNNKIDLEIRILDGILKLLNAICSAPVGVSSSSPVPLPHMTSNPMGTLNPNHSQSMINSSSPNTQSVQISASSFVSASQIINSLDSTKFDESSSEKCASLGTAIAHALMSTKSSSNDVQTGSGKVNPLFDPTSPEYNHVMQILNACKCLFVSHRKIAIYLQSLNAEKKKTALNNVLNESTNIVNNENSSQISIPKIIDMNDSDIERGLKTCKLTLSDIRIPLSWKYSDHLRASKNSESISSKFATFAIIYLGNMIYDTQLISNIDASYTDICFSDTFIFEDVRPDKFEITIEVYSYELCNTTNNLMQSARKLAKQFGDFASFGTNTTSTSTTKRGSNHPNQQNQNVLSQMPNLFNTALTNSAYSYSMHRFCLIAKSTLTQDDIDLDNQASTKSLQLLAINPDDHSSSSSSISSSSSTATSTIVAVQNRLPLFDYYSCLLRSMPSSSFI